MANADETTSGQEVDLTVAGQHVRAKGYRLIDLIWLPMVLGVAYTCLTLYNHEATAQQEKQTIAAQMKESNKAMVDAVKESNIATVQAIKELATEQKKSTAALKETACLLDPAIRNRQDGREFCKRLTSNDR